MPIPSDGCRPREERRLAPRSLPGDSSRPGLGAGSACTAGVSGLRLEAEPMRGGVLVRSAARCELMRVTSGSLSTEGLLQGTGGAAG